MDVEDVDVRGAELAERLGDGDVEVFGGGADGVGGDFGRLVVGGVGGGVFCGDNHFVSRERKERKVLVKGEDGRAMMGSKERGGRGCKLEKEKEILVPDASLFHPFTKPHLGLFILIIVAGINEVSTLRIEVIEDFEDLQTPSALALSPCSAGKTTSELQVKG